MPPEDPDALAQAIRELVNDPERRQRLGRNGRLLVESNYSWFGIVERWLNELLNSERDFCNDVQPISERASLHVRIDSQIQKRTTIERP